MRMLFLVAATAALSACAATPQQQVRSPQAQQQLDRYLAGKAAGAPQSCLPTYRADDMVVIDDNTIIFRDGASRVWRAEMEGGCPGLGRPGVAMVTRQVGSAQLCRGEIAQLLDTSTGMTVGSCSFGDFVPYAAPPRG